jgi:hypothetical protein
VGLVLPGAAVADPLPDHRPQLRYDSRERDFATSVEGRGDVVYGREKTGGDGRRWLQYWLFYEYNAQDRGVFRTGRHEGDWEFAQVRLGARGSPDRVTLAQHTWAESCSWDRAERRGKAPVLYPANGSHATYATAGTADRPFPDPNDEADGRGRRVRPDLTPFGSWVRRREPWGGTRAGWVPGEQSSPVGPAFQPDARWSDPSAYDRSARSCGSGPPGRPWQTPAVAVVLLGAVLLGVRRRIARR